MKATFAIITPSLLVALFAASCEKKPQGSTDKPPLVKGARLEKVTVSGVEEYYESTGTVRSKTTTVLSSKTLGGVMALHVREGDPVRRGQVLAEIDSRGARAHLEKAQAALREAQQALAEVEQSASAAQSAKVAAEANKRLAAATFARYQTLYERKSASPQEFDEVKGRRDVAEADAERADNILQTLAAKKNQALARIDQAKADVANAEVYVGYARITSPINGVVTARQTEIGSTATPGAPLLTIEDGKRYRLEAAVEESRVGRIRLKDKARVRVDALGPGDLEGIVAEIVPAADPASRSYTVKIDLPAQQALRSGLYGMARFVTGRKQAVTIAEKAVVQRGQLTGVYVVDENGRARLRLIKTGKSHGDRVEVLSGLGDGERIVVDGVASVSDGSRVQ